MASEIIWEEGGILVKHSGTVTSQEVMSINDMIYGDIRFEKIIFQIADYTAVKHNRISVKTAKIVGTLDRTSSIWNTKKMRLAIITADENFIPVAEAYFKEFIGTVWEGRIFDSLDLAYHWVRSA